MVGMELKVPCECYTRVVGFYRPVSGFNPGKLEEFKERKTYIIPEGIFDEKFDRNE
jgi:ribonucleoside-triphosphate reductase